MHYVRLFLLVGLTVLPLRVWAADAGQENSETAPVHADHMDMGAMNDEDMMQDNMVEPKPTIGSGAHAHPAVSVAPEPAAQSAGAAQDPASKMAAPAHPCAGHKKGCACGMCALKKSHGPKDMVMMNMMMHKMKAMHGPRVIATYDGGVVVIEGNKMVKYDDELNFVNEVELKKRK